MYSAFDHWAHWSHMLTVITMCSLCAQWVFGPLSPVSASEDPELYSLESRPALQMSQMTSLPHSRGPTPELDLGFDKSRATFQMSRTTSTTSSRVTISDSDLEPNHARPLGDTPLLDGEPSCATCKSLSVVWPADLTPVDEYDPRSEPEPPDPSCASH